MFRGRRTRKDGFTLVEIMMVVGLSSIVMLGIVEMFQYTAKSSKAAQVSADWASLKMQMTQAISMNPNICNMIAHNIGLQGVNIDSTVTTSNPQNFKQLVYPIGASGGNNVIATVGQNVNGLQVYSMSLIYLAPNTPPTLPWTPPAGAILNHMTVQLQVTAGLAPYLAGSGRPQMFTPFVITFNILDGPYNADGSPISGTPPTVFAGGVGCGQ